VKAKINGHAWEPGEIGYSRFLELFPDNDACLDYLKQRFYRDGTECPKCGRITKFHRIRSRGAYSCQYCRHQVYPTAGTIFHRSNVGLQLWFWTIYLMSSTHGRLSARQLARETGVTSPTAYRMLRQIRAQLFELDLATNAQRDMQTTAVGDGRHAPDEALSAA